MALNNSQYDTIIRAYEQKQLHNRNVLDKRYKTVYNRLPELKEINDSISLLSVNHARKLLDGDESALPALKEEIRKLSEQSSICFIHNPIYSIFWKKKILIHFLFLTTQIIILTQKPGALLSQI